MKKFILTLAFMIASVCAFASPASDAIKTFFAKGNCVTIDIQMIIGNKETVSVFSAIPKEKISMLCVANGNADGKAVDAIGFVIEGSGFNIPMKYVKSITNDSYGNVVITLIPLDEKNGDKEIAKAIEYLLSNVF